MKITRGDIVAAVRTSTLVRAALLRRGQTINSWARGQGYDPETARRVFYRWTDKTSGRGVPTGAITRAILRDLSLDLGIAIPPGIDWAAADAVAAQRETSSPRRRAAGTSED